MLVAAIITYTICAGAMWGVISYAARETGLALSLSYYLILSAIWPVTIVAAFVLAALERAAGE